MKITDADRKNLTWGQVYSAPCPYCLAAPTRQCVRTSKSGVGYLVWDFHTARKNQAITNSMFIIAEEPELADALT